MSFKDLLVYVDNDSRCEARVRLAADLAIRFNAHLCGAYVLRHLDIPSYASVRIPDSVLDAGESSLRELADNAGSNFLSVVDGLPSTFSYEALEGGLPEGFSARARCADLSVLPQSNPDDSELNANYSPDEILLQSGRPVLVVPFAGSFEMPLRNILLTWNASRESARAIHDAMPLLREAEEVCVVSIGEQQPDNSLVTHLAHHGIELQIRHLPDAQIGADELLLSLSADLGTELIVMGGYGHSRFRETVLGGMTRNVLAHMTVPVLMSH